MFIQDKCETVGECILFCNTDAGDLFMYVSDTNEIQYFMTVGGTLEFQAVNIKTGILHQFDLDAEVLVLRNSVVNIY